eukprot:g17478.t1
MTETPPASKRQELQVSQAETEASTPLLETDYEAIAAAVMETERGRWFLQEYARRNRNTDTQTVLTALDRLEKRIGQQEADPKETTSVALLSHDLIDLAGAISQVKKEVAELGGQGNDPDHFNTATVELEAIVEQTESATSEILEAAEKIQEVIWLLREEGANETQCDIIESKIIEVYTACSFQDLTGQRSNKVVQLVGYVERRIASMMSILGLSDEAGDLAPPTRSADEMVSGSAPGLTPRQREDERPDADLLNGPAMAGEGNEQGDVDALFDEVVFNEAPEFGADPSALMESETTAPSTGHELLEAVSQAPAVDEETSAEAEETIDQDDFEFRTIENSEVETETVEPRSPSVEVTEPAAEASAEADATVVETSQPDFGDEDDNANTPDAADVFGFDVEEEGQLIELQDAEFLTQPEEELTRKDEAESKSDQDVFEIDPLSFGGETIGSGEDTKLNTEIEAEADGAPKMVVGLPGDFDLDSNVADMFVGSVESNEDGSIETSTAEDDPQDLIDGQDIFEAESVDVDGSDAETVGDEASIDDAELELAEPDTHELIETTSELVEEDVIDDAFAAVEAEVASEPLGRSRTIRR